VLFVLRHSLSLLSTCPRLFPAFQRHRQGCDDQFSCCTTKEDRVHWSVRPALTGRLRYLPLYSPQNKSPSLLSKLDLSNIGAKASGDEHLVINKQQSISKVALVKLSIMSSNATQNVPNTTLSGLVATLALTGLVALVYILIFLMLRRSNRRWYAPRTYLGTLREQ
jgi:hypothetical protein